MATVGSLGDLVFSVSQRKIITPTSRTLQTSTRYAQHNRHLKKPLLEYLGADADTETLEIVLSAWLGVNPEREYQKLKRYAEEGKTLTYVMGGRLQGSYRWVIEKVGASKYTTDRKGRTLRIVTTITIKEYPRR